MSDDWAYLWQPQPAQPAPAAGAPAGDDWSYLWPQAQPPKPPSIVPPWLDPSSPIRQLQHTLPTPIGSNAPPPQAGIVDAGRRVGAAFLDQVPGAVDMEEAALMRGSPVRYLPDALQESIRQGVIEPKRQALAALGNAVGLPLTHEATNAERDRWRALGHGDTSPAGEAIADTAAEALGGLVLNPPLEGLAGGLAAGAGKLGARAAEEAPAAARAVEEVAAAPKRVSAMSIADLRKELLTSDKADLPNRRAFHEAQATDPKPVVVMSDVDGLKHINDTHGHAAGDALIKAKADALRAAGVDAFHLQGDEFASRFATPEEADAAMARVKQQLAATPLLVRTEKGTGTVKGVGFSYGVGNDLESADAGLLAAKSARRASGEAAARGAAPAYDAGVHPAGGDSQGLDALDRQAGVDPGSRRTQVGAYPPGELGHEFSTKGASNVAGIRGELEQLAADHSELIDKARGGRQSVGQYHDAQALSDQLGMTVDDFLKTPAGTVLGSRELALGKSLMGGLRDQVKGIADELASGSLSGDAASIAKDKMAKAQTTLVQLMATLHGRGFAEGGRILRSAQESVGSLASGPREELQLALARRYRDQLEGPSGEDIVHRIAALDPQRPEDVMGFLRQMEKPNFNEFRASYWFGSILSGTKTLARNAIGNVVKLAVDTAIRPVAAGADKVLADIGGRERGTYASETVPALVGLHKGLAKGWEKFLFVMKNGYDPERLVRDLTENGSKWEQGSGNRLPADPFVLSQNPNVRRAGAVLNFGPRLLEATDALSRSIADTSERYAWATRQALHDVSHGKATSVGDRAAALLIEQPEEMVQAAKSFAARATYTDKMSGIGGLAANLRGFLNKNSGPLALGDHVLPFIHVSDRVAASITDFIPGAKPMKLGKALASKSPEAADMVARQVVGGALGMLGLSLAAQGRLTGAAPKGGKQRDDFYGEGKQPYSLLIGGKWLPMRDVLGPLAGPFVAAAAMHDNLRSRPPGESMPETVLRGGWGGTIETARYMLDASYLQSLQSIVSSIEDDEGRVGAGLATAATRTVGGYLPFSGLQRGAAQAIDPRVVQRDSMADELKSSVPGLRNTLDARIGADHREMQINTGRAGGLMPFVPTASTLPDPVLAERASTATLRLRAAANELSDTHDRITSTAQAAARASGGDSARRLAARAKQLREEHPEYRYANYAKAQADRLATFEDLVRRVRTSPTLTPEEKAQRLRDLQLRMSLVAERALTTIGRAQQ